MVVNVGVVGTGFGQAIHVPGFQQLPGVQVLGLWGREQARTQTIALKFGVPMVFASVAELAQHPDIHAVSLSTPPHLHYEQARTVLAARKALFCEKPLALNATEAQEMLTLAEQARVMHGVDFEFRTVPHWLYLKEQLGRLGPLRLVEVVWQVEGRADPQRLWNWYSQRSQGGGCLGAIGSHAFDYVEWLVGPIGRLQAQLTTSIRERPDAQGQPRLVDSDDICNILFNLADGTPGTMLLSTATWRGQGHWVRIYGEQGTLVLGSDNLRDYVHGFRLWYAPAGGELTEQALPERLNFPQTYPDGRLAPFMVLAERFVQSLQTRTVMTPSLKEGLRSQILIDAAHQSQQTGSWVTVWT
ncbi:Gfo/Idh/MocA family protein [Candidatus Cyanaurora vandensis]|uniref:Gfo/Idh/MocA family protein n=1 Tax=Candidatus Cyanaurora vandensis TaxID=2714958 RepID=UPI00257B95F6|nr:Gfo/Idh/MocA family oxidoreductase [Candidatus Cyanaurora vandensis]